MLKIECHVCHTCSALELPKHSGYYLFTLYVPVDSHDSNKIYKELAELCCQHLPARHAIKVVTLEFRSELMFEEVNRRNTPDILPSPIKQFMVRLSEHPDYKLTVFEAS